MLALSHDLNFSSNLAVGVDRHVVSKLFELLAAGQLGCNPGNRFVQPRPSVKFGEKPYPVVSRLVTLLHGSAVNQSATSAEPSATSAALTIAAAAINAWTFAECGALTKRLDGGAIGSWWRRRWRLAGASMFVQYGRKSEHGERVSANGGRWPDVEAT
jgi:hypothetical protein